MEGFYDLFCDSYYSYRSLRLRIEQRDLDLDCPACPRPHETGPLFLALDGNLRLFRFKSASKHPWSHLDFKSFIEDIPKSILDKVNNFHYFYK
jgi:hypothetical protein